MTRRNTELEWALSNAGPKLKDWDDATWIRVSFESLCLDVAEGGRNVKAYGFLSRFIEQRLRECGDLFEKKSSP